MFSRPLQQQRQQYFVLSLQKLCQRILLIGLFCDVSVAIVATLSILKELKQEHLLPISLLMVAQLVWKMSQQMEIEANGKLSTLFFSRSC